MPSFKTLTQALRQSLSGAEQDYATGSLRKAVFLLAIPMILELSLESVFAVVDMFFVGKLGQAAIATVGLTESVISLVYSLAIGLSTAATAVVARRIGEKDAPAASKAGAQSLLIGVAVSILVAIIGSIFAPHVPRIMGAAPEVVALGTPFARIMLGGATPIMLLFLINGIFRGAGDAAMAMKSLWVASALNIILCPIFIHFFGLTGAAIATLIGRSAGVVYQCIHLAKGSGMLRILPSHYLPDAALARSIFKIAWPATLQFIIASGSWIVLARLVAETGGTTASAGYQIAIRNVVFFILPAWGLSNAAATLVGQNLGAGKLERAEQSVRLTAKYNALFMGGVMLLFILCATPIISVFSKEAAVVSYGAQALRIIGCGYVFYGIGMVMTQALNGAGDTRSPTVIYLIGFWCFQIPFAYFMARAMNLDLTGIFIAIPAAETLIALVAFWVFSRGKWKTVKV